jgi:membrane associated rhomboid family serine protease
MEAIVRRMDVCYRHPGRETGVSCSNCGRPICPECMTPTSVGMRCPECGGQRTRVRTAASIRGDEPTVTYVLLGIIVLVQLGAMASGANATGSQFGGSELINDGALSRATVADGEVWRLITSGFLHAGFVHLLFNGFALYVLGTMLEPAIGHLRFAIIYFASLLAGSFGALLVEPDALTVGASGAIFGLMGAAVVVMRNRGINPMESGLGLWLGINLVFTFAIPGISIGGHLGGLVGGALAAALMFELGDRLRMPRAVPVLLGIGVGAASVVGCLALAG